MDVECLLFTDLMLICKASKRMEKYKIVKPPMRVDRIITHDLRDKGKGGYSYSSFDITLSEQILLYL